MKNKESSKATYNIKNSEIDFIENKTNNFKSFGKKMLSFFNKNKLGSDEIGENIEATAEKSEVYSHIVEKFGETSDFTNEFKNSLMDRREYLEDLEEISSDRYLELYDEFYDELLNENITEPEFIEKFYTIRNMRDKNENISLLSERIADIHEKRKLVCYSNETDFEDIMSVFRSKTEELESSAPFSNYKENTDVAWRYIPDNEVRQFFSEKKFISLSDKFRDKNIFDSDFDSGFEVNLIKVRGSDDFIEVSTDLFVEAAGFSSWHGRISKDGTLGNGLKDNNMTSINTMKNYASRATELPPVGHAEIFIQPDGLIYATNVAGDSHRIGAAYLRGEKEIKVNYLTIKILDKNVLDSSDFEE